MYNSEEFRIALVAILAALLLAASEVTQGGIQGVISIYAYWVVRILIESTFFMATLYAIERFVSGPQRLMVYATAILISLVPFTLAVTSMDLIVGLPELGLNDGNYQSMTRFQAFGMELIYLFDNHLVLCSLLLLPRILSSIDSKGKDDRDSQVEVATDPRIFHETIEPPLVGQIWRIEAQEHYIRITTSTENRMILYRFSDAVREMPSSLGMQVHRSHWVAYSAIRDLLKEGQKMQLQLVDEEIIPVSKSFQVQVENRFTTLPGNAMNT